MPSRQELVAHNRDDDLIAKEIGADVIIFQVNYLMNNIFCSTILILISLFFHLIIKELEDLLSSCRKFNPDIKSFDCSVFNGEYVTGCVTSKYLEDLENIRNDSAKGFGNNLHSPDTIGLHNDYGCNGKS